MSLTDIQSPLTLELKDHFIYKINVSEVISHKDLQNLDLSIREVLRRNGLRKIFIVANLSKYSHFTQDAMYYLENEKFIDQLHVVFVIYGLNPLYRAALTNLIPPKSTVLVYEVQNEKTADIKARILKSEYLMQTMLSGLVTFTGIDRNTVEIKGKKMLLVHDKNWEYKHPKDTYFYKIDIVDSNIFVSRPSGYIEYNNSLTANTLFDKAVYKMMGDHGKYYRIQDYTNVVSSTFSARRDFIHYISDNIDRIELMVFYGLNAIMKTIVKMGKYFNPQFYKVKVVETFDEAMILILNHKYGGLYFDEVKSLQASQAVSDDKPMENQVDNSLPVFSNNPIIQKKIELLFKDIGNLLKDDDFIENTSAQAKDELLADIYNALYVLKLDINEFNFSREKIFLKLQKQLGEMVSEIKNYKTELSHNDQWKNDYIDFVNQSFADNLNKIIETYQQIPIRELAEKKVNDVLGHILQILEQLQGLQENISIPSKPKLNNKSSFQIETIFNKLVQVYLSSIQAKNLDIHIHIDTLLPKYLIGDESKIVGILDQFLENAVDYTNTGNISLRAKLIFENPEMVSVRFSVQYPGIGVSPTRLNAEISDSDFKKFNIQGFTTLNKLGLNYCNLLAGLIGGETGNLKNTNDGSEYYLELKLEKGMMSKDLALFRKSKPLEAPGKENNPVTGVYISHENLVDGFVTDLLRRNGLKIKKLQFQHDEAHAILTNNQQFIILSFLQGYQAGDENWFLSNRFHLNHDVPVFVLSSQEIPLVNDKLDEIRNLNFVTSDISVSGLNELIINNLSH